MGTKWKRSRAVLGFVSFALGVSLVLVNGLPLADRLSDADGRRYLSELRTDDFQQTAAFRNYLSGLMDRFIAMGAGGPLDDYYHYGYSTDEIIETTVISAVAVEGGYDYAEYGYEDRAPTEADKERWKKQAQAYHEAIQDDKNILYEVRKGNEVLYSNTAEHYDHANLPSGYKTALSFFSGSCTLTLRGEPVSIYGEDNKDRYVDGSDQWYLPGYVNFPAGKGAEDVSVFITVADSPALYVQGDYTAGGTRQQNSRLYWLEQDWRQGKQALREAMTLLGAGCTLLVLYVVLRKDKANTDRAIARVTGHIWFELKLFLALAAVVFFLFPFNEEMRHLFNEVSYAYVSDGGAYWQPWFFGAYWSQMVRRPGALLAVFWALYLFVNDLRYGDKPWRHGICGMLRAKSLKLPIQKRLSRRAGLVTAILLLLALALLTTAVVVLSASQTLALTIGLPAVLLAIMGVWAAAGKNQRQLWADIGELTGQISAVKAGDLTATAQIEEGSDLYAPSQELAQIGLGMERAVEEQTRSERMKVELVTNVSHDLKTPLTSIISYAELLKQEHLEAPAGEYVEILSQKAERLRAMVLDVFEISKAASGELPVKLEELDLSKLLRQTLADMAQAIDAAPVTLRQALRSAPVIVVADGDRLYRVFQNLIQNALKYALEGSRVYLSLEVKDGRAVASIKNTSKTELPEGVDFTARFVRGDASRTDGGSGLGLAIADSFTRACGGELRVEPVADLFVVTVAFPLAENSEISDCVQKENPV